MGRAHGRDVGGQARLDHRHRSGGRHPGAVSDDRFDRAYLEGVLDGALDAPAPPTVRAAPAEPVALHGTVLTPDRVMEDGHVVIDLDGTIAAVQAAAPQGARVHDTGGVILPGLIDLHGHPEFNVFAAWEPPKLFANRYRWRDSDEYHTLIRDTQNKLLEELPRQTQARYAEIRALVGGVTAIQGASAKYPKKEEALVRNVDLPVFGEQRARAMIDLPSAGSRDEPRLREIVEQIGRGEIDAFYVHLAEGRRDDPRSQGEFAKLTGFNALTKATVIIHGTALSRDQLGDVRDAGAKVVWSPQSNLRLYGDTTLAADALDLGVTLGLGADWLPSGSPSLLAEMQVARRWLRAQGADPPAKRLVQMMTSDAAAIAGLQDHLGTLAKGRPADVLVLERRHDDPWESVLESDPSAVELVTIGGDLAYGRADWIGALSDPADRDRLEPVIAWGREMVLDTSYSVNAPAAAPPTLADLRTALVAAYPRVGPIFA
jgi:5-methylthioadenosine/S-adenosylhomocysteine deaminase